MLFVAVGAGGVLATTDPFSSVLFVAYMGVGSLLAVRRPGNAVSWIVVAIAFGLVAVGSRPNVDVAALLRREASVLDSALTWLGFWSGLAVFVGVAALAAVFPTGRMPRGRWRRPLIAALAGGLGGVVLSMFAPTIPVSPDGVSAVDVPNPLAVLPDAPFWSIAPVVGFGLAITALAMALGSMLARYRQAADVTKLQLRWLLAAIALLLFGIVFGLTASAVTSGQFGGAVWMPVIVALPAVPLAIGIAIFRYRLYDIDRIINRALVYGAVTAILAGVFAGATVLSQRVLILATGQSSSDAAIVLTTLVVATLYTPVRKRVEVVIDRYFKYDQRRYGPYTDELKRLLELVEPVRAAERLAREAMADTSATGVAVTNKAGDVVASVGIWPADPADTVAITIGAPFASVVLGPRRDGRRHDPTRLVVLAEVGALAIAALEPRTASTS